MALDDFTSDPDPALRFKKYNCHELDEKLEDMVEDFRELFPKDFRLDFIEVSTAMEGIKGRAYYRVRKGRMHYFIRISEKAAKMDNNLLSTLVLHELVHIYLYNLGYKELSDGDPTFHWVLGAVGAQMRQVSTTSDKWRKICQPFIEEGHGLREDEYFEEVPIQ